MSAFLKSVNQTGEQTTAEAASAKCENHLMQVTRVRERRAFIDVLKLDKSIDLRNSTARV